MADAASQSIASGETGAATSAEVDSSRSLEAARCEVRGKVIGELHAQAPVILVYEAVLDEILLYSDRDARREIGGFLLGRVHDPPEDCCEIAAFVAAEHTRSTSGSLTFTHETWATLNRALERRGDSLKVLGWHHTHPGLGVFFSGYDEFVHRHFFDQRWQVAMVVDPVKTEFGFFQWVGGRVRDCGFVWARGAPDDYAVPSAGETPDAASAGGSAAPSPASIEPLGIS